VDVFGRLETETALGTILGPQFPIFPLNTDGIDPAGSNILIKGVNVTCYDDAIVVKPSRRSYKYAQCSSNITIEDIYTFNGVGMSVGTVAPNPDHNCIDGVIFRNIVMDYPLKGIYLKNNPGKKGDGIVQNIRYENLTMNYPVWWAIYVGPQQQ